MPSYYGLAEVEGANLTLQSVPENDIYSSVHHDARQNVQHIADTPIVEDYEVIEDTPLVVDPPPPQRQNDTVASNAVAKPPGPNWTNVALVIIIAALLIIAFKK